MVIYLRLGGDHLVPLHSVIAVLDGRARRASATQEFLHLQRSEGRLVDVSGGRPNSLVITDRATYLSPLSAATLWRRARAGRVPGAPGGRTLY